jgi:hypothetical protein
VSLLKDVGIARQPRKAFLVRVIPEAVRASGTKAEYPVSGRTSGAYVRTCRMPGSTVVRLFSWTSAPVGKSSRFWPREITTAGSFCQWVDVT